MGTAPMGTAPMGTAPMGAAPGHVAPLLRSHPWRRARGCELWQGRARSAAPRHRDSDNLTVPMGTAGGLQGSSVGELSTDPGPLQRGPRVLPPRGCAHHPGAATRHPSACSTPKPPAAHPHRGAPQVLQETRVLGGPKSTSPALGPPGALPEARLPSLPFSCPLASAQGWKLPPGGTWSRKGARRPRCPARCPRAALPTHGPPGSKHRGLPAHRGVPPRAQHCLEVRRWHWGQSHRNALAPSLPPR